MSKDEAMKAMAREIVGDIAEPGWTITELAIAHRAALAAIMETQRLDAELADKIANVGVLDPGGIGWVVAEKIRTGDHYALAGDRPDPSNLHKAQNAPAHLLTPESDNAGI